MPWYTPARAWKDHTRLEKVNAVLGLLYLLDFVSFGLGCYLLGGDALNGKVQDGHYLLFNHGGGVEVSRAAFLYSKWHAVSLFAFMALLVPLSGVAQFMRWRSQPPRHPYDDR